MIVAILMGRKDSKGFPGKNLHRVLGMPLAYYPMKAAMNCPEVDKAYLSTDDEYLMGLARDNGVLVIERPPELCTDEALGDHVYMHAYDIAKRTNKGREIEMLVLLMCNAPTITPDTITKGINILRENPEYDSCVTVSKYNMWSPLRARKITEEGLLEPVVRFESFGDPKNLNCDRDSQGDVWFADMGVSIIRPRCLENIEHGLLPQKWMGRKIYPLKQWGGLDVDFEWQVPQVEHWLSEHGFPEKTPDIRPKPRIEKLKRPARRQPGRIGKIRLDKNENTTGLDREILAKALKGIDPDFITSYPEAAGLYRRLSDHLGLSEENLVITFGSDGAIRSIFEAFVESGDEVITLNPTYAMYDVYCDMFGAKKVSIDYDRDLGLPHEKIIKHISGRTRLVAVPNPNSPTATAISRSGMLEILKASREKGVIVLADEAYYGFYGETMLDCIKEWKNLVVTRTFSKTAGLASCRIGYAAGDPSIIEPLYKVKPMYESSGMALRFAEFILDNQPIVDGYIDAVREGKEYLARRMERLGLRVLPSHANFLVIRIPGINDELAESLASRGILIKGGYPHPSMKDTIRVTAGPRPQMEEFMKVFESCFEHMKKKKR